MSHTPDRPSDDVITQFLRTRSADAEPGVLDDIMRTVGATPQDRPWLGLRPIALPRRTLLIVAIALLLATMGAIAVGSRLLQPDALSSERMTFVAQVIDAINSRDVGSFRSSFTADGTLEYPGIDGRAGREGNVYRHDQPLNETPPAVGLMSVDTWGLEARIGSCRTQSEASITCQVRTRWHVLQLEIGEEWTFEFDGAHVRRLDMMARVDPDPTNRVLPLGLGDLERWATWLTETHPGQADRLLPTGPDVFAHYYFRFGLDADPAEIGASIEEYLESRDPLVGTYVCAEDGNPDVHLWDVREDGTITRVSGETGEALPAGTWSRDNGQLLTTFGGGMTWFATQEDRLVGPGDPGGWTCTPGSSK